MTKRQKVFQPTRAEMYEFKRSILSFVRQNPWSTRSEVAEALDENIRRVENALHIMGEKGLMNVRTNVDGRLIYRNTRAAFKLLADEYENPRQITVTPRKKVKVEIQESLNNGEHVELKRHPAVTVEVIPSQVTINLNGVVSKVNINMARSLFQQMKNIPGIE